jgi:SAM-dependent methyltransferase
MQERMTTIRWFLGITLLTISLLGFRATSQAQMRPPDVEYVPSPPDVVIEMLKTAGVTRDDVVYDLGCGDGRFVITAAQTFGARGVGIDIDPARIRESNENARKAGVTDRVTFTVGDLFKTDLGEATVITLYLLPELNVALRPRLLELRPGTRIVSHEFDMGEWAPDKKGLVENATFYSQPYLVFQQDAHYYFWVVPGRMAGDWRWSIPEFTDKQDYTLHVNQHFQEIDGTLGLKEKMMPVSDARLEGDSLNFSSTVEMKGHEVIMRYRGRITGDSIQGRVDILEGPFAGSYDWAAARSKK